MTKEIDCRGLACPKPVILAKKELDSMESGEISVIADNITARENLQKLAQSEGCTFKAEEKDGLFYVAITKEGGRTSSNTEQGDLVILVGSDKLGNGDDKLGTALMKSYMFALSESHMTPKTLLFVNGGVHLTTEGSDVLDSLRKMEDKGTEIMSCGTCLDFYNLKGKLVAGTVSNMYTIVEKMNGARNTIKL
jgi:selenium metabolism protein YedF